MNTVTNLDAIAPLVVAYCRFLSGHGGRSREDLLQENLTPEQRRMLLDGMSDADFLYDVTSPFRKSKLTRDFESD